MRHLVLVILIMIFSADVLLAQQKFYGTIEGTVTSAESGQPLVGVNIILKSTVIGTTTDANGMFVLQKVPVGDYTLAVSLVGYKKIEVKVTVNKDESTDLFIQLEQSAIQTPPVVITASKREQSLEEIPVSISIVDDKTLTARNTITISDALQYVPGVNINRSQVNIRGSTGYSYGVGTRVMLLVDGLPFLTGDTDEIIWESIPTSNVERIEVVKGAGSALYGSSALGGVINVITKSVRDMPETKFRVYGGLYEMPKYSTWKWADSKRTFSGINVSHLQQIKDFGLALGGSRTQDDSYKRNDDWKRWNFWSRFGYNISAYQTAVISFNLLDQRRGNFLFWKDIDHALEPQEEQLGNRVQSLRYNLSGSYKQFVSDRLYSIFKVSWFRSKWEDNIPSASYPMGSSSFSDYFVSELQTNYQLSDKHYIIGGILGSYNRALAETIFGKHYARGGAFYLQDEIKYSNEVRFTVGGRYDYQKMEGTKSVKQFNPKFGVVFEITPSTTMRASVGRGFRAPSVAEVFTKTDAGGLIIRPNPKLKPERSWSFEFGGTQIVGTNFQTELSIFRNEFWDLIEPVSDEKGEIHFQNIIRARTTGIEAVLNLYTSDKIFQSQLSYTYVYPEDVMRRTILNHRSRHLLYLTNNLFLNAVQIGLDFRFISKIESIDSLLQFVIRDAEKRVANYIIDFHTSVDWKFVGIPIIASLHINNVLQYYYTDFIGSMAPLRNYVLTLESRL